MSKLNNNNLQKTNNEHKSETLINFVIKLIFFISYNDLYISRQELKMLFLDLIIP